MRVEDLFPGVKVKIVEGRYKGDVGKIISYEKNSRGYTKVEVRIPIEWYDKPAYERENKEPPEKCHETGRSIISWMSPVSLELIDIPELKEVRSNRRLLIIEET